jgi:TatD DNase family protein
MLLFDTHAHYDNEKFDLDRDEVLKSLEEKEVGLVLNAASDIASSKKAIELARKYNFIYASAGIHPHEAKNAGKITGLEELANNNKVVAIGEIGLDYYYDLSPREVQLKVFIQQIEIALEMDLPVIIHDREAHNDCLETVKKYPGVKGVFHCYSGSAEMAKEIVKLGMYISFAGPLTYKNAKRAVEAARSIPKDRILIETDCPYLAPEPYRGKRNFSGYLINTAEKLAEILEITTEEAARMTMENGKMLFGI